MSPAHTKMDARSRSRSPHKLLREVPQENTEPTAEQRQRYREDGYLHVKGFFNESECLRLQGYVKELQDAPEEPGGTMMYFEESSKNKERILSRVEDFCRNHEGMASMMSTADARLLRFASALHNEDMLLFKDKINFKLPGGDGFKAHQDSAAGWERYLPWFVSLAVWIDPATRENGCIEVAPGYHKKGLLGATWEPIEGLDLPYQHVECGAGDLVVFDSYVPHRSAPNNSSKPRRAAFITYNKKNDGDKLDKYYADKRSSFPPDIERPKGKVYKYRV